MRSGDVVVVSLEYDQYGERGEQAISVFGVLEQAPEAAADFDVDWPLFKLLMDGSHSWVRGVLRSDLARARGGGSPAQPPYARSSFNAYGDVVAHWTMPAREFISSDQQDQPDGDFVIAELNHFAAQCAAQGVRVFAFHPTTTAKKFAAMRLDRLAERVDRTLKIKQLNRIAEMRYPPELFFDSTYHLTYAGVERRTRLLAERLAPELGARASVASTTVHGEL